LSPSRSSSERRKHFPILEGTSSIVGEVYLDSAATTHRAAIVINAISGFYARDNANPAAALHCRARRAHERFEAARETVARFLGHWMRQKSSASKWKPTSEARPMGRLKMTHLSLIV
jgi:selenocysteine lyase/cysteine desulfurase